MIKKFLNWKGGLIIGATSAILIAAIASPIVGNKAIAASYEKKLLKEKTGDNEEVKLVQKFSLTRDKFKELVGNLKIKEEYKTKFTASLALELQKSYSFDLSDAIDWKPLQDQDKSMTFELKVTNQTQVENGVIKNIDVIGTDETNHIYYSEQGSIKGFATNSEFNAENNNSNFFFDPSRSSIKVQKDVKDKTATSVALELQKLFSSQITTSLASKSADTTAPANPNNPTGSGKDSQSQSQSTTSAEFTKELQRGPKQAEGQTQASETSTATTTPATTDVERSKELAKAFKYALSKVGIYSLKDKTGEFTFLPDSYYVEPVVDSNNKLKFSDVNNFNETLSIDVNIVGPEGSKTPTKLSFSNLGKASQETQEKLIESFNSSYRLKPGIAKALVEAKLGIADVIYASTLPTQLEGKAPFNQEGANLKDFGFWFEAVEGQKFGLDTKTSNLRKFKITIAKDNASPSDEEIATLKANGSIKLSVEYSQKDDNNNPEGFTSTSATTFEAGTNLIVDTRSDFVDQLVADISPELASSEYSAQTKFVGKESIQSEYVNDTTVAKQPTSETTTPAKASESHDATSQGPSQGQKAQVAQQTQANGDTHQQAHTDTSQGTQAQTQAATSQAQHTDQGSASVTEHSQTPETNKTESTGEKRIKSTSGLSFEISPKAPILFANHLDTAISTFSQNPTLAINQLSFELNQSGNGATFKGKTYGEYIKEILTSLSQQLPEGLTLALEGDFNSKIDEYTVWVKVMEGSKVLKKYSFTISNVSAPNYAYDAASRFGANVFVDATFDKLVGSSPRNKKEKAKGGTTSATDKTILTSGLFNYNNLNQLFEDSQARDIQTTNISTTHQIEITNKIIQEKQGLKASKDGIALNAKNKVLTFSAKEVKLTSEGSGTQKKLTGTPLSEDFTTLKNGTLWLAFKASKLADKGRTYFLTSKTSSNENQVGLFIQKLPTITDAIKDQKGVKNIEKNSYVIGISYVNVTGSNTDAQKASGDIVALFTAPSDGIIQKNDNKVFELKSGDSHTTADNGNEYDKSIFKNTFSGNVDYGDFISKTNNEDPTLLLEINIQNLPDAAKTSDIRNTMKFTLYSSAVKDPLNNPIKSEFSQPVYVGENGSKKATSFINRGIDFTKIGGPYASATNYITFKAMAVFKDKDANGITQNSNIRRQIAKAFIDQYFTEPQEAPTQPSASVTQPQTSGNPSSNTHNGGGGAKQVQAGHNGSNPSKPGSATQGHTSTPQPNSASHNSGSSVSHTDSASSPAPAGSSGTSVTPAASTGSGAPTTSNHQTTSSGQGGKK